MGELCIRKHTEDVSIELKHVCYN